MAVLHELPIDLIVVLDVDLREKQGNVHIVRVLVVGLDPGVESLHVGLQILAFKLVVCSRNFKVLHACRDDEGVFVADSAAPERHELLLPRCVKNEHIHVLVPDLNTLFELFLNRWLVIMQKSLFHKTQSER